MRLQPIECPIFVTYEKKDDISETTKYEDKFVDPQMFSWMTLSWDQKVTRFYDPDGNLIEVWTPLSSISNATCCQTRGAGTDEI